MADVVCPSHLTTAAWKGAAATKALTGSRRQRGHEAEDNEGHTTGEDEGSDDFGLHYILYKMVLGKRTNKVGREVEVEKTGADADELWSEFTCHVYMPTS